MACAASSRVARGAPRRAAGGHRHRRRPGPAGGRGRCGDPLCADHAGRHRGPRDLSRHFFPVCSPALLANGQPIRRAADLFRYPLIHFDWLRSDSESPTWHRWLATARSIDPDLPRIEETFALSFREELHAIEAVIAGQGIAVCSDIVVGRELEKKVLVKAHDLSLPGYGFYLVHLPDHRRQSIIEAFSAWMRSAA
jgi:LysR family glycine cleavage system transcriptional activator